MNRLYRFEFLYKGIHQKVVTMYCFSKQHAINFAQKTIREKYKMKLGWTCEIYLTGLKDSKKPVFIVYTRN